MWAWAELKPNYEYLVAVGAVPQETYDVEVGIKHVRTNALALGQMFA